jgi:ADP-ribose pyrophosphatase YjhB (NUDIX family)
LEKIDFFSEKSVYKNKMCLDCKVKTWLPSSARLFYRSTANKRLSNDQKKRAGVILTCRDSILIVRSFDFWGFPKGSVKTNEPIFKGALRELFEETGIDLRDFPISKFQNRTIGSVVFFCIEINEIQRFFEPKIDIVQSMPFNDSTGVGWVKVDCIRKKLLTKSIRVNCILKKYLTSLENKNKKG